MECLHGTAAWRADGCGADESRMGRTSHSIMPASLERWLVGCARPLPFRCVRRNFRLLAGLRLLLTSLSVVNSNFVNLYRLRRNLRHSNETGSIRYIRKYSDMWWTTPEATERRRPGLWTPWRARTAPGARTRGVDENPAELLACWCGGWVGAGGPATRAHRRSDQEAGAEAWQRGERQEQLAARCWAARLHLACVWLREAGRSRACTRGRPCPGRHCRRHPCCFARARSVAPVLQRLTAVSFVCVSSRGACACADGQASAMN